MMGKWQLLKDEVKQSKAKKLMESMNKFDNSIQGKANELYLRGWRKIEISRELGYDITQIDKFISIETKADLLLNIEMVHWYLEDGLTDEGIMSRLGIDSFMFNRYKDIIDKDRAEKEEYRNILIEFYMAGYEKDVISDILGESALSILNDKIDKQREHLVNTIKCHLINGLSVREISDITQKDIETLNRLVKK